MFSSFSSSLWLLADRNDYEDLPNVQIACKMALNCMITGPSNPKESQIEDTKLKSFR